MHQTHKIGDYDILLPVEHRLPEYQAAHRLYDRFLPTLCLFLHRDGRTIIDVGANVGDTTIAIVQRCENPILAIEGEPLYLEYLHRNVASLPAHLAERITVVPAIVGSQNFGDIVRDGTSARRLPTAVATSSPSIPLDAVLGIWEVSIDQISLIKVDTDGFDWDVLLSGQETLAASRPLLYWENYVTVEHKAELERFCETLGALGYNHLSIFDNFGNLMLAGCQFNQLMDLTSYVWTQDRGDGTRTIYYTDVLAGCDEHSGLISSALGSYQSPERDPAF